MLCLVSSRKALVRPKVNTRNASQVPENSQRFQTLLPAPSIFMGYHYHGMNHRLYPGDLYVWHEIFPKISTWFLEEKDSDAEASPPATYAHKFWPWMTLENYDGDGRGNMQDHAGSCSQVASTLLPRAPMLHMENMYEYSTIYKLPVLRKRFAADHDMHASSISWHYVTSNMQTYPIITHLPDWSKNWSKKNGLLFQMNMFAATRGQSRISFDMLKSLRRV